jgi:peptidylprolyl isomerase
MADVNPAEVSAILRQQLAGFKSEAELEEVGTVLQVGDGIARIYGLSNVQSGELIEFENGLKAIVLNLEEDNVGAVILGSSNTIKEGDVVKVHYTGKLANGEQFDSSVGREPLEFTVGAGMMIKGFDAAMPGMAIGEKKTISIAPEDGYGEKSEDAIIEFPKENVPEDMKLEPGMSLTLSNEAGHPVQVVVVEVKETVIVLDANHFLAGQELIFDIELVEIV